MPKLNLSRYTKNVISHVTLALAFTILAVIAHTKFNVIMWALLAGLWFGLVIDDFFDYKNKKGRNTNA